MSEQTKGSPLEVDELPAKTFENEQCVGFDADDSEGYKINFHNHHCPEEAKSGEGLSPHQMVDLLSCTNLDGAKSR